MDEIDIKNTIRKIFKKSFQFNDLPEDRVSRIRAAFPADLLGSVAQALLALAESRDSHGWYYLQMWSQLVGCDNTTLTRLLKSPDSTVRGSAAAAIAVQRCGLVDELLECWKAETVSDVKEHLIYALSLSNRPEVLGVLRSGLVDEDEFVVESAMYGIYRQSTTGLRLVLEGLDSTDPLMRSRADETLWVLINLMKSDTDHSIDANERITPPEYAATLKQWAADHPALSTQLEEHLNRLASDDN
jgi:hypothetical protein